MGWKDCDLQKHPNGVTCSQALEESLGAIDAMEKASADSKEFGERERNAVCVLVDLAGVIRRDGPSVESCRRMKEAIIQARRPLGAPGDWGYGYPEGDALQWLYGSVLLLAAAENALPAGPAPVS